MLQTVIRNSIVGRRSNSRWNTVNAGMSCALNHCSKIYHWTKPCQCLLLMIIKWPTALHFLYLVLFKKHVSEGWQLALFHLKGTDLFFSISPSSWSGKFIKFFLDETPNLLTFCANMKLIKRHREDLFTVSRQRNC